LAAARQAPEAIGLRTDEHAFTFEELAGLTGQRLRSAELKESSAAPYVLDGTSSVATVITLYALLEQQRPVLLLHPKLTESERKAALGAVAGDAVTLPGDTALIVFTSGTTGVPKGVVIPARAVRHSVGSIGTWLGLRASDRLLEACELTFDPSVHNMFATWEVGASVHVLPTSRTLDAVKFARQAGLTVWSSVPSLVALLGQVKALGPGVLPGLRLSLFGGEQLPAAVVTAWRAAAPNSGIFNLYGPTEATVACTGIRLGLPSPITPGRDYMSIGRPLPGCRVAVVDASWRPVEDGEPGELAIAGVQLSDGYVNRPDLTADRFVTIDNDRWYLTGDRAMRDADGNLHWLGRLDNQVKILGHRVELEEVDAHLRAVADVDLVGTVAWPLTEGGSATGSVAFVGAESIDAERIQAGLRARLPAYMVPSRIVPLEAIPLNANGKVDRGALRRLLHAERA